MEYNFNSLIDRLNVVNFGEDRRKGAIDTDKLPDKGWVIVDKSPDYISIYYVKETKEEDEIKIRKSSSGRLGSYLDCYLRTKPITIGARINDLYIFDSKKEAQQFLDDTRNKCVKDKQAKIGDKELKEYLDKIFARYKVIPILKLKEALYAVFGETGNGEKSEEYVVCLFEGKTYVGTFVRVGNYYGNYAQLSDYKNLRNAKIFASKLVAENFIKDKKMKGFKAIPLSEALKLQDALITQQRQEKIEAELRKKQEHEEYLKSDKHKKELELAKKKREKQKEIKEGTYKVTFRYSNSWLGSETFTVHAKSINDAFEKAKSKAIARDPYCTYDGYDQRLRFNKDNIVFIEEE